MRTESFPLVLLLIAASCTSTPDDSASAESSLASGQETVSVGSLPSEEDEQPDSTRITWLRPELPIDGLQLIEERNDSIPDCGPVESCLDTVPAAVLDFESSDPDVPRSLTISQRSSSANLSVPVVTGLVSELQFGGRTVQFSTSPNAPDGLGFTHAVWTEPDGKVVSVSGFGLTAEEFTVVIETMRPS